MFTQNEYQALRRTRGTIKVVAAALGVSPIALVRREAEGAIITDEMMAALSALPPATSEVILPMTPMVTTAAAPLAVVVQKAPKQECGERPDPRLFTLIDISVPSPRPDWWWLDVVVYPRKMGGGYFRWTDGKQWFRPLGYLPDGTFLSNTDERKRFESLVESILCGDKPVTSAYLLNIFQNPNDAEPPAKSPDKSPAKSSLAELPISEGQAVTSLESLV